MPRVRGVYLDIGKDLWLGIHNLPCYDAINGDPEDILVVLKYLRYHNLSPSVEGRCLDVIPIVAISINC